MRVYPGGGVTQSPPRSGIIRGVNGNHWVALRHGRERSELAEAELVLTAVAIPHRIDHDADWTLSVRARDVPAANAELFSFAAENRERDSGPPGPVIDSGLYGTAGYVLAICAPPATAWWLSAGNSLMRLGRLDADAVAHGQWWRTITALTLHADLAHLAGNAVFGAVFGTLAARCLGSGLAWCGILVSAALANAANALLQGPGFYSIGASTATFSALGITAAVAWRRGYYRTASLRRSVAPVFAALALLAYTGIGAANTDIGAHVFGLLAGGVLGHLGAPFDARRLGRSGQWLAGLAAVVLLVVAWGSALARGGGT